MSDKIEGIDPKPVAPSNQNGKPMEKLAELAMNQPARPDPKETELEDLQKKLGDLIDKIFAHVELKNGIPYYTWLNGKDFLDALIINNEHEKAVANLKKLDTEINASVINVRRTHHDRKSYEKQNNKKIQKYDKDLVRGFEDPIFEKFQNLKMDEEQTLAKHKKLANLYNEADAEMKRTKKVLNDFFAELTKKEMAKVEKAKAEKKRVEEEKKRVEEEKKNEDSNEAK